MIAMSKVDRRGFYLKLKMMAHGLMEEECSKSITDIALTFLLLFISTHLSLAKA